LSGVHAVLNDLSADFRRRYGDDLTHLAVEARPNRPPLVVGHVVVDKQLQALQKRLRQGAAETRTEGDSAADDAPPAPLAELKVAVLAQLPGEDPRLPWRAPHPAQGPVPLYAQRRHDKLASEWLAGDGPARVIHQADRRWLLQLRDGTLGWAPADLLRRRRVEPAEAGEFVSALRPGQEVELSSDGLTALCDAARREAARALPYRLGGRDPERGLDCSALVQGLLGRHAGVLLPRHSSDQMRVGRRVPKAGLAPGDLVFARPLDANFMHVGLVVADGHVPSGILSIVHACRLRGVVTEEPLTSFFERYRFLKARRVWRGER
jgi:hypothetical protein